MSPYRLLSALLCYPETDLLDALGEVETALAAYPDAEETLQPLMAYLATHDLISLQENYVATFDRNRSHSLHLFEHVHGESRDRGQAMVDLLEEYRSQGLEPATSELPDYVPLFLEFLSLLPDDEARTMLAEPAGILRALTDRLAARNTGYMTIMAALADIAAAPTLAVSDIPAEDPDDLEAMDASWEEAAVRFGPGEAVDACGTDRVRTQIRAGQRDARKNTAAGVPSRTAAAA